ncbi:MAG TPA: hypothetical protein VF482_19480 [Trebonia sp.]
MAATLHDILLAPRTRPNVVADCEALIDQEVAGMSGVSGTAVKLAYRTVKTFASGHVHYMVETLLPRMADELQPYWADFNASGGAGFGDYLAKHGDEVAESLLTVTDERGRNSNHPTVVRAYNAVRGSAAKHVRAALPQVAALVQKYAQD